MVPGIQRLLSRTETRTRRTDVFAARYAQLRARRVRTIRRYLAPTFLHRLRVFRDASPSEVGARRVAPTSVRRATSTPRRRCGTSYPGPFHSERRLPPGPFSGGSASTFGWSYLPRSCRALSLPLSKDR